MNEQERQQQGNAPDGSDPSHPIGGNNLNQIRERASAFHAAADAAIDNVLSGDSEKFNQDARQHGGQ
jgi:hypothetical protein